MGLVTVGQPASLLSGDGGTQSSHAVEGMCPGGTPVSSDACRPSLNVRLVLEHSHPLRSLLSTDASTAGPAVGSGKAVVPLGSFRPPGTLEAGQPREPPLMSEAARPASAEAAERIQSHADAEWMWAVRGKAGIESGSPGLQPEPRYSSTFCSSHRV